MKTLECLKIQIKEMYKSGWQKWLSLEHFK